METTRLVFNPYTNDDFPFFASLWADKDVVQYIGKGTTRTIEEARKSFNDWLLPGYKDGRGLFLITLKETNQPIGHAGIVTQIIDGKKEYEIGYWLSKNHWGKGYASEAAAYFHQYAINTLGFHRVICLIQERNTRSIKVAEKLGMKFEKTTSFNAIPVQVFVSEYDY
ncbi:GNAT family N-acetyltransferase [Bacillus sp. NEB1478]|uniref:GNAT family N-acetyltransferase n=1 Tax=Bacillus sp. NEB1478 TaxID=3073816 RepID=UPI0028733672|nr:GNAT family N-acetyltransferase [Bacillus sp. NEB1478]WNB92790.1 GNAT family N-acetyltransferase [Bacillus sp. NEB1478]